MDAKDILGLPKNALQSQEKKFKAPRESQRKPDGISREVFALTGGLAPLMPAVDLNQLKRNAQSENEKITWQWLPFTNYARKDNLQLYHWVRVLNGVPPTGDYSFSKFNKSVDVVKYTDEEYEKCLTDPMRVYFRSYAHEQMVQAASSSAGLRTIKRVEQTLQDLGVILKPRVPTKAVCSEHLELRKEILTLLNLQKQRSRRAAELDRTFTPDPISSIGERFGKRDKKRKGTGRLAEAPSSPAHPKRPRKFKASD